MLQPRHRVQHLYLHLLRHGGGKALHIQLLRIQTHRLDEQLVPGLAREPHHLRLDGRAVPGADALDDAGVDGASVQILPDDPVRLPVGVGQIAHRPVFRRALRLKAEGQGRGVPLLYLHFAEIHAAPVDTRRRAGLEPAQGQSQRPQAVRQRVGRVQPVGAGGLDALAHDGLPRQIGAGTQDHGSDLQHRAGAQHHGGHMAILAADLRDLRLPQRQVGLQLQRVLHDLLVFSAVGLCPQRPDGGALAPVQHPVLDARLVRRPRHLAAQRVQLPHQMPLARAADGRVAGHVAHRVQADRQAYRLHAHPRRRQRRLDARVTGADHRHVIASAVKFSHIRAHLACINTLLYPVPRLGARDIILPNLLKLHKNFTQYLYNTSNFLLAKQVESAYNRGVKMKERSVIAL